ncbi:glycoside hydrolase/deacetylase [Aureobasidium subglaciale]|nr:glycoside hydrolase/deacetylase [Aureobasidium subglaciale]
MHFTSLIPIALTLSSMVTASAIPDPLLNPRQSSPTAGVVYSKCSKPGVFALAFDDGPGAYTQELINTLNTAGAKATFFFTGTLYGCIYNRAAAVKAAYNSGHQVASHTWTHPQTLDSMSVAQLTTEMQKLETAFVNIIGVKPTYMRPPYLKTGGNVPTAMRNLGYKMITDSVDSQDWNGLSVATSEQRFRSAGPKTSDGFGHISLLHETYANTVRDLVPRLIKWAKENDLKMVTVAECLGDGNGAYVKGTGGGAQKWTGVYVLEGHLSNIVSFLQAPLVAYATVSSSWKPVIEQSTFGELHIDSGERLNQLYHIFTHYQAVRQIDFTVLLPRYGSDEYARIESTEDRQRNDAVSTKSLWSLFQALRLWQGDSVGDGKNSSRPGGVTLVVRALSKSDIGNMEDQSEKRRRVELEGDEEIGATRFESSHLHLDGELPKVAVIAELEVY